jgi:thiamine biosynthesis lipoprotein
METVTLALNAMNTRFELVLQGSDPVALRAAGEEALHEIERVEGLLSAFQPTSEISELNARAVREPVQLSPEVFALLQQARDLWDVTAGAFDITVGPLMRCWGFWGKDGRMPDPSAVETALACVGSGHLEFETSRRTVRFTRPNMTVDLGAIGKGYAIGQAIEILGDHGIGSALLHGGTSTTYGLGAPAEHPSWRAQVTAPPGVTLSMPVLNLRNAALSVSAIAEKSFTADGDTYGHVIDPRTGWPVRHAVMAAVTRVDPAEADALSTALMVSGAEGLHALSKLWPGLEGVIVDGQGRVCSVGLEGVVG